MIRAMIMMKTARDAHRQQRVGHCRTTRRRSSLAGHRSTRADPHDDEDFVDANAPNLRSPDRRGRSAGTAPSSINDSEARARHGRRHDPLACKLSLQWPSDLPRREATLTLIANVMLRTCGPAEPVGAIARLPAR